LLSSRTFAADDVSANPKLLEGVVTQPCTSAVTSIVTYCPARDAENAFIAEPIDGAVAAVTADSLHAEVTGERLTIPVPLTRFTNTVSDACAT
jgi:hypothetical protein